MNMALHIIILALVMITMALGCCESYSTNKITFIVQMADSKPEIFLTHTHWYNAYLQSSSLNPHMLYVYKNSFTGFAARFTMDEARSIQTKPGVLRVIPEATYKLQTTRTPAFLGVTRVDKVFRSIKKIDASNVIIGMMDTGVWPESRSFHVRDEEFPPIPVRWRGECVETQDFSASKCNRKLIGARFFKDGFEAVYGRINETLESKSPRDTYGHGTHTMSIAGGLLVRNVSLHGYAHGNARGMAKDARVAAYKVCWFGDCISSDILAGMDKALEDGVDIISASFGDIIALDFRDDLFAIAAFKAALKGVFVSSSAGNGGPYPSSVVNTAPWITTVGAGTLDRDFPLKIKLGNNIVITGASLYWGRMALKKKLFSLFYAWNSSHGKHCDFNSLSPKYVTGKIVVCDSGGETYDVEKGEAVIKAKGVGLIVVNSKDEGEVLRATQYFLPAASVTYKAGNLIKAYINSTYNPSAMIGHATTLLRVNSSPKVMPYSARGPALNIHILKPDIIAPGENILAAWSPVVSPTETDSDKRRVDFNILSGTSMACPHVTGIAAMIKGFHPDWSPAAIRSAIVTTATTVYKKTKNPILVLGTNRTATPYDMGGGQVNILRALHPGLVYDISGQDYIDFLCAMSYRPADIIAFAGRKESCSIYNEYRMENLNYPSFSVTLSTNVSKRVSFPRTLTNVDGGGRKKNYTVLVKSPRWVKVRVEPKWLVFNKSNEKINYTLILNIEASYVNTSKFGYVEWNDNAKSRSVRSQIAVTWEDS